MAASAPSEGRDVSRAITDALRTVYDPCCREKGISVVDMGLIESVRVDDGTARVELVLTSGWCPFAVDLVSAVRDRVASLPEVAGASVEVRWDRAWATERLSPEARAKLRLLPDPAAVADRDRFLAEHRRANAQPREDRSP